MADPNLHHLTGRDPIYFEGRWFAIVASVESPVGRLRSVTSWREIDEGEARTRHGAEVDAALRAASKHGDDGGVL